MPKITDQPPSAPRHRLRTHSLRTFATGCSLDVRKDAPWFDRIQYRVEGVGLRFPGPAAAIQAAMVERGRGNNFTYKFNSPSRRHTVFFRLPTWLFSAKYSFTLVERFSSDDLSHFVGWIDLSLNPTRCFAHLGAWSGGEINEDRLRSEHSENIEARRDALDGNNNIIADAILQNALLIDWPSFTQSYADAVARCLTSVIGLRSDFAGDGHARQDVHDPVLRMPLPEKWRLRQIEVYHEYKHENAIELVNAIRPYAVGLSRHVQDEEFSRQSATWERIENAHVLTMDLGRDGISLVIYAKTFDRVRFEIRYAKSPLSVVKSSHGWAARQDNPLAAAANLLAADAMNRLNTWFDEFNRLIPQDRQRSSLASLKLLLMAIDDATSSEGRRNHTVYARVLYQLMHQQGLSPSGNQTISAAITVLMERNILVRASANQTRQHPIYRLSKQYSMVSRQLLRLEEMLRSEQGCIP